MQEIQSERTIVQLSTGDFDDLRTGLDNIYLDVKCEIKNTSCNKFWTFYFVDGSHNVTNRGREGEGFRCWSRDTCHWNIYTYFKNG